MAHHRQGGRQQRSRSRRLRRKTEPRRSREAAEAAAKKWLSTTTAARLDGAAAMRGQTARAMHPLRPAQRDDRRRAQGRARAQARFRRAREAAGLAQGPGQFRHRRRPPRRGDALCRTDARRGRATAFSARKAAAARAPTRPIPGSSIRSTAPPISCTAFRISPSRSRSSARARWSPA